MSTGWLDNTFLLLLGVAGVWVFLRFVVGPRRGAPSFGSLFRREAAPQMEGLGQKAIATLLADTRSFAIAEDALRGLLLAGPFAVRKARQDSLVVLVALCDAPERYSEAEWVLRWAYPARGHKVLSHKITRDEPGHVAHQLTLRGAPPVALHFVAVDRAGPPDALRAAVVEGFSLIEDPAGEAERLRRRWDSLSRNARTTSLPDQK